LHHFGESFFFLRDIAARSDDGVKLQSEGNAMLRAQILFQMLQGRVNRLGPRNGRFKRLPEDSVVNVGEDISDKVVNDLKLPAGSMTIMINE
jgi:hypothetical protein